MGQQENDNGLLSQPHTLFIRSFMTRQRAVQRDLISLLPKSESTSSIDTSSPATARSNYGQATSPPAVSPAPNARRIVLGSWGRIWTSVVHVPPNAITIVLVWMNLGRWYWFGERDLFNTESHQAFVDTVRNFLQLAAKLHELFVVASLGAITLNVFQHRLVQSNLPLGLFSGAYRVGDVPYLGSTSYWSVLLSRKASAVGLACSSLSTPSWRLHRSSIRYSHGSRA